MLVRHALWDHGDGTVHAVDDVVGDAAQQCAHAADSTAADDDLGGLVCLGGLDDRGGGGPDGEVTLVHDRGEAFAVTLEASSRLVAIWEASCTIAV